VVKGNGAEIIPSMMNDFSFDHVFYTGSTAVGKIIYKLAAEKLIPVSLELGGKSPCIVEDDANIRVAAKRIAIAKFSNAGQMCVAPDYVLVKETVKDKFIEEIKKAIRNFFSDKPEESYNYGKIINDRQFDRLSAYLAHAKIISGGRYDKSTLFIEPTLVKDVNVNDPIMKEEIFGPILPVIGFNEMSEALAIIRHSPNPLAFYVFTSSGSKEKTWLEAVPAGGGCINNCSWHFTNHYLPFGGRGFSGMGAYHGKYSFETFSHKRALMKTPTWFDPAIKYPPFKGKLGLFKKIIK
jgi:aldehyde dehydrogenase (NAD+)